MSHVSSKKVNKKVLDKIYNIIFSAISDKNVSRKCQRDAFGELLTHTEKIMLGKRLLAVSLLSQGMSKYRVHKILCLTPITVSKLYLNMEKGKFSKVEKLCNALRKGPLQHYIENLFKPLPRYGTSPSKIVRNIE